VNKRKTGGKGEEIAAKYLAIKGYKLLTKNFYSVFGEIDLIALEKDTLCFIEVKLRSGIKYGRPEEAVGKRKLESIRKTGDYFKLLHPELPQKFRIEVVAIILDGNTANIKHIKAI
jgi:putative endonuclease